MAEQIKKAEDLVGAVRPDQFFDEEFAAHLERKVRGSLAQEKKEHGDAQIRIAKELRQGGSVRNGVMGQKMGSVDARTYHRWNQEWPGCWRDPEFVHAFFADNPQCRSPGWRPNYHPMRKGITFQNGAPITPHRSLAI
jgi:hypothetical protein